MSESTQANQDDRTTGVEPGAGTRTTEAVRPPRLPSSVEVFDTTLRDGLQVEGVSATVDDKLRIAEQLDYLGVHYIEGGWPGANPKDIEFFAARTRSCG